MVDESYLSSNRAAVSVTHVSAVSSPLQHLGGTRRVPQSQSAGGALLAPLLFLRFLARCVIQFFLHRRDVNRLPGDWIVEAW